MAGDESDRDPAEDRPAVVAPISLPAGVNVRRAFDIYVAGRSRTLAPAEKTAAAREAAPEGQDRRTGTARQVAPELPQARVEVPRELRFDRNAGTWRSS